MKKPILPIALIGGIVFTGTAGTYEAQAASNPADIARQHINESYTWGANDCSGFTQKVFKKLGIDLPHNSAAQTSYGTPVSQSQLQPGDLVFFQNTYKPGISHVGIYVGGGQMISAENEEDGVQVANITTGYWSEHYATARRVVSGQSTSTAASQAPKAKVTSAQDKPSVKAADASSSQNTSSQNVHSQQNTANRSAESSQTSDTEQATNQSQSTSSGDESAASTASQSENAAKSYKNASSYTVQKGDTLSSISLSVNVSASDLKTINGLSSDRITAGQVLKLKGEPASQKTQAQSQEERTSSDSAAKDDGPANAQATNQTTTDQSEKKDTKAPSTSAESSQTNESSATKQSVSSNDSLQAKADSSASVSANKPDVAAKIGSKRVYMVRAGDTLWAISRDNGISVAKIQEINHLDTVTIYPGQKLYLKNPSQKHTVKRGDTLWAISKAHGVTVKQLMQANHLTSTTIYPDQQLIIPE
ncbi:LysM peptidoglycan-binding domain-containing protein [Sporolactobacillus sp. THM7-7]|nr:LysM peptidoglycan-binding domain-containing protein [Sporolactobacillus sp. THM7-7]